MTGRGCIRPDPVLRFRRRRAVGAWPDAHAAAQRADRLRRRQRRPPLRQASTEAESRRASRRCSGGWSSGSSRGWVIACNTASTIALGMRARCSTCRSSARCRRSSPRPRCRGRRDRRARHRGDGAPALCRRPRARFAADCTIIRYGSPELVELAEAKLRGDEVEPRAVRAAARRCSCAPGGDGSTRSSSPAPIFRCSRRSLRARFPAACLCRRRRRDRPADRLSDARASRSAALPRSMLFTGAADPAPSRLASSSGSGSANRHPSLRCANCESFSIANRAETRELEGGEAKIGLNYDQIFEPAIERLHARAAIGCSSISCATRALPQRALLRRQRPEADHRVVLERLPRDGPAPEGHRGDGRGAARCRRRLGRHPQHRRQHPLPYRARA